jgi:hypothetical protein
MLIFESELRLVSIATLTSINAFNRLILGLVLGF